MFHTLETVPPAFWLFSTTISPIILFYILQLISHVKSNLIKNVINLFTTCSHLLFQGQTVPIKVCKEHIKIFTQFYFN